MTLSLAIQTESSRVLLALALPAYRPSSLIWAIAALVLAVAGMAADVLLGQVVGSLAIYTTTAGLGLVLALLDREWRQCSTKTGHAPKSRAN